MNNSVKANIPVVIIAIVEIIVGIFLIVDPVRFTFALVRFFGIILMILGIVFLFRFLAGTRSNVVDQNGRSVTANPVTLIVAIIAIIFGAILTFGTVWIMGLIGVAAIIFGVCLVIFGILKIKNFADKKKANLPASPISIIGAILSVVLGIIIVVNPFTAVNTVWLVAGIALIVTAVVDITSLFLGRGSEVR